LRRKKREREKEEKKGERQRKEGGEKLEHKSELLNDALGWQEQPVPCGSQCLSRLIL